MPLPIATNLSTSHNVTSLYNQTTDHHRACRSRLARQREDGHHHAVCEVSARDGLHKGRSRALVERRDAEEDGGACSRRKDISTLISRFDLGVFWYRLQG